MLPFEKHEVVENKIVSRPTRFPKPRRFVTLLNLAHSAVHFQFYPIYI